MVQTISETSSSLVNKASDMRRNEERISAGNSLINDKSLMLLTAAAIQTEIK